MLSEEIWVKIVFDIGTSTQTPWSKLVSVEAIKMVCMSPVDNITISVYVYILHVQ